jgi:hypothetical protein
MDGVMKGIKSLGLGALMGAALLAGLTGANASTVTDDWTWNSPLGTGGGTLTYDNTTGTTSQYGGTEYLITNMTGFINAFGGGVEAIAFLANPNYPGTSFSPSGFFFYDDAIVPNFNPLLSNGGLLFIASGLEWNIYSNGAYSAGNPYILENNNGQADGGLFSLVTPLPSTWTMLIAGFLGLGYFAFRGTKNRAGAMAAA